MSKAVLELNSLERLEEMVSRSQPFVVRSEKTLMAWPACRKWVGGDGTLYLTERCGEVVVDVAVSDDLKFSGDVRHAQTVSIPFKSFLEHEGDPNVYLAQCPLSSSSADAPSGLAALLGDIKVPASLGGECGRLCSINLWMNRSRPVRSTLHYDAHNNLLCCLSGTKEVTLLPPDHQLCMGTLHSVYVTGCNHSTVLLDDETWQEMIAEGNYMKARIGAGDCLFLPEGWMHQVGVALPFEGMRM
ncbi:hypothetical protein GUITHDRAFT_106656 [Guillardia theta CCMP2712]|uniref:Cupin-like domain-containing protein n=1 Tax=Guillardia theta (strain CCMP2712) TaxID=905079 RepID=L1JGL7_GUITC|nr:hypothetical protein GUITHDRAFT_106656 [Guillardia theta CCMP2712]EKX47668.1 hypothetical protein GUITHDRAFT_106656 [Guillardia theta CCMP2712]|eukprot:XP_005834648.1 hypothetical protein GUITHDRAFT_106656 [Guillardia theta CCMP2712]